MNKRPAFQFYPADWRNDAGLRLCSIGARGLWIDAMCLMHDGEPYGHLTVMGRPISPEQLARLVGESAASVKRWLGELSENEVLSTTDDGIIYSRRMVRDEDVRNRRGDGGQSGGQFGHLGAAHGAKGGRPRKEKPPLPDDERGVSNPPPSTSSSTSSPSPEVVDASHQQHARRRAMRLPDEWEPAAPPASIAALLAEWPPGREQRELDGFRDYWRSRSRDAAKLDWDATWHNRIRDQHDRILRETRNGYGAHANGRAHRPDDAETSIFAARRRLGIDG